jgi:hypothetical protein
MITLGKKKSKFYGNEKITKCGKNSKVRKKLKFYQEN